MPSSFDSNNAANDQWRKGISAIDVQLQVPRTPHLVFRAQFKNPVDTAPQKFIGAMQQLKYSE
ncbi:MAG TPA: hypothetical protein VHY32_01810 [Caulobacteraceae bacterium]|jgi:hypothetical protein|nr:hypothetical protein [Caulobacteraceae bacterium]